MQWETKEKFLDLKHKANPDNRESPGHERRSDVQRVRRVCVNHSSSSLWSRNITHTQTSEYQPALIPHVRICVATSCSLWKKTWSWRLPNECSVITLCLLSEESETRARRKQEWYVVGFDLGPHQMWWQYFAALMFLLKMSNANNK